jgi:hypothetical protein
VDPTDLQNLSPREWLEHERQTHGCTDRTRTFRRALDDLLAQAGEDLPPEYEWLITNRYADHTKDEFDDLQIAVYWEPLKALLSAKEREVLGDVYFGIFPTYSVNAYAGRTPRGDRVVMVHDALPTTVVCWASFFLYTIEQGGTVPNEQEEEVLNLLCWVAGAWKKNVRQLPLTLPNLMPEAELSQILMGVVAHSAMAFILGHEAGHILERHTGYNPTDRNCNHSLEFAADTWGLRLCLRSVVHNGAKLPIVYSRHMLLGPYLALATIATITDIQGLRHPSATERLERVVAQYKKLLIEILTPEGFKLYQREMGADFLRNTESIGRKLYARHKAFARLIDKVESALARKVADLG